MLKNIIHITLVLLALSVPGLNQAMAGDDSPACIRLDTKASGGMEKYSVHGEANGPIFFSGIRCAIEHRNKELCAMEMVSFDATAKVYDYYTGEEIEMGKAYFWFDEKNNEAPIVAFGSRESAEKRGATTEGGVVLDYVGLTGRDIK